jgi:hypothetical protein
VPAQSGRNVGPHGVVGGGNAGQPSGVRQFTGGTAEVRHQAALDRPDGPNGHYNTTHSGVYDRRQRSAYGIHNSFDKPAGPSPWPVRFIDALSKRSAKVRARYIQQSNTGQVVPTGDDYADKLQTQWRRGAASGGTRADPITQTAQIPTLTAAYPHYGVSAGLGSLPASWYGMDPRNAELPNGRRPMYLPRFQGGQIRLHSETSQRAGEYLPTRFSTVPPMRIVRMKRYGTGMMAGSAQFGTRQTWGQGPDCLVIAPARVVLGMKSRGVISVRGLLSPKGGTGRERIPAIFSPSTVQ